MSSARIASVVARQIFSSRGHPGIETTVTTDGGATGTAQVTAGHSVGAHEVQFLYDGGTRWQGKGVSKAVRNINEVIAPGIRGEDPTRQRYIDAVICELDGTPNKAELGGNATAAVSAAVLRAGAQAAGLPLYQHIGGVAAFTLPVPGVIGVAGSSRYGSGQRSGNKPSYSFIAYGFDTFSEASYACWETRVALNRLVEQRYGIFVPGTEGVIVIPPGVVDNDCSLWDLMSDAIGAAQYEGRVGLQVDVAATTYYDPDTERYRGLFSRDDKSRADMLDLYAEMVRHYPFVIIEDPLHEDDYDGHAVLTRDLGIQVVGDDLFTTNPDRLRTGVELGACNTMLLKVNQVGTISEALDAVNLAYQNGYGVMPCSSRGEGAGIADYAVGLGTGTVREGGTGGTANRFLKIESDLGSRARFIGEAGLKRGTTGASRNG